MSFRHQFWNYNSVTSRGLTIDIFDLFYLQTLQMSRKKRTPPCGRHTLFAKAQEILRGFLKVRVGGFVFESQIPVQPCMGVTPNPKQSGTALTFDKQEIVAAFIGSKTPSKKNSKHS